MEELEVGEDGTLRTKNLFLVSRVYRLQYPGTVR
jgi:hypothetical protein